MKLAVTVSIRGSLERFSSLQRLAMTTELRRRVQFRFNKREANNALDWAVFFNRLGGLSDRTFENQRPSKGSGLATGFGLKMT